MLKSFYAALSLIALSYSAHAHELPRSPGDMVQAFETRFNAADLDGLLSLYTPGAVFVAAPGKPLSGKDNIKGALQQLMAAKLPIKVRLRHVYQNQDTAIVISDWSLAGKGADGKAISYSGTATDVVQKNSDGAWQYAIDNPFGVVPAQ